MLDLEPVLELEPVSELEPVADSDSDFGYPGSLKAILGSTVEHLLAIINSRGRRSLTFPCGKGKPSSSLRGRSLSSPKPSSSLRGKPASFSDMETLETSSFSNVGQLGDLGSLRAILTVKYNTLQLLGDRVLVKIKAAEELRGQVVAVGPNKVSVKAGTQVVYSLLTGTEVEFNGTMYLMFKEDDIIGILDTDDIKDLKPLNDRLLIKAAGESPGLSLAEGSRTHALFGTVIAVGPGKLDEKGKKKALSVSPGNTVLYSSFVGSRFRSSDGVYTAIREYDVMVVLS